MSTNPGVTSAPAASISRRPVPSTAPTSAITPSLMATSAVRDARPVPSTSAPPRITSSLVMHPFYHGLSRDPHCVVGLRRDLGEALGHRRSERIGRGGNLVEHRPEVGLREHRRGDG